MPVLVVEDVLVVTAAGVSAISCSWLLMRLVRMRELAHRRLFFRQLCHLSIADLFLSAGLVLEPGLRRSGLLGSFPPEAHAPIVLCSCVQLLLLSSITISALVEVHIAVGLACTYWRWCRALEALNGSLPYLWIAGVVLPIVNSASNVGYDSLAGRCSEQTNWWPWCQVVILSVSFSIVFIAYFCTFCRVRTHPGVVQASVWRMLLMYPASYLCTFGLIIFYFVFGFSAPASSPSQLLTAALAMEGLSGIANTLTYAFASRYMHRLVGARGRIQNSSGHRAVDDRDEALSDLVSFHVGFRSTPCDSIILISDVHEQASRASEREIRQLEAGRCEANRGPSNGNSVNSVELRWPSG
mmetsp:Transcript_41800/g.115191  ORF Transcript_41800/g.115191 Transcript_41800/m.115191 type:complete len:355 (+) Transcript_41800:63-1127(+)